jgi:hypothetical protein
VHVNLEWSAFTVLRQEDEASAKMASSAVQQLPVAFSWGHFLTVEPHRVARGQTLANEMVLEPRVKGHPAEELSDNSGVSLRLLFCFVLLEIEPRASSILGTWFCFTVKFFLQIPAPLRLGRCKPSCL